MSILSLGSCARFYRTFPGRVTPFPWRWGTNQSWVSWAVTNRIPCLGGNGPRRLPPGQQELLDILGLPDHPAPVRVSHLDPVQAASGDLQVSITAQHYVYWPMFSVQLKIMRDMKFGDSNSENMRDNYRPVCPRHSRVVRQPKFLWKYETFYWHLVYLLILSWTFTSDIVRQHFTSSL